MKKLLPFITILLVAVSCNIFNPTGITYDLTSNDAKITEAKNDMNDRNYSDAIKLLTDVIGSDSTRSEAYYLRGKATLRLHGVDVLSIWAEINPKSPNTVPFLYTPGDTVRDSLGLPVKVNGAFVFYPPLTAPTARVIDGPTIIDSVFNFISNLHRACKLAYLDLNKIEDLTKQGKSDNVIRPITYRLDYGIESFLTVTLEMLADYNKDGWVSLLDTNNMDSGDKKMYQMWCDPAYADFSDIKNIKIDSIKALTKDPNKINQTIDSTLLRLDSATIPSIDSLKREMQLANNPQIDTNIVKKFNDFAVNIRDNIAQYRYNDLTDNDSDAVVAGSHNRMVWIDYNHNGLIDVVVDTLAGGVLDPADFKRVSPGNRHIGDYLHYINNPTLYGTAGLDTTLRWFRITNDAGADSVRIIKFKKYYGQPAGEWISGDWGVDEEIMDGKDNDCDGIIDEDTRIVEDTLDDDGDWWDTNGDHKPQHMEWIDSIDHDGKITLGDGTHICLNAASVTANPAMYIYLTQATYNARTDLQAKWPMKNGVLIFSGKITYVGPPSGEWTGGDFGVDEEIFDGKDNDGDGLIDEDVSNEKPSVMIYKNGSYIPNYGW